jgi:SAM-dependent methyltransferase
VRARIRPEYFDRLYARDPDPWGFASSRYEAVKYDATIAALDGRRFGSALELGASIGVLSARLAPLCDELLAIDVAEAALARARERLAGAANVRFERREIPEQFPAGPFDLIVASEVLYYLDEPAFAATLDAIDRELAPGAVLLAVHWRPATETYPLRGDEVHARLAARFGAAAVSQRTDEYALDRFDRPA